MTRLNANLLRGTLELLVLRALAGEAKHGYGIRDWIDRAVSPALVVEEGTLYPALHRLEDEGFIRAEWGVSENQRKAKYYALTRRGRSRMASESAAFEAYADKVLRALRDDTEASAQR